MIRFGVYGIVSAVDLEETYGPIDGIVVSWYPDEGWGILRSPQLTGDVFCHFSAIESDRYIVLQPGDPVSFTWNSVAQDGCQFSAVSVTEFPRRGAGSSTADSPPGQGSDSYDSSLTISPGPTERKERTNPDTGT